MNDIAVGQCPFRFPAVRDRPFEVPQAYTAAREHDAPRRVEIWNGEQPWLLCRHDQVRQALSDRRLGVDVTTNGYPHTAPHQAEVEGQLFIRMDGERHMRNRRSVIPHFTVKQAERWRPRITQVVDEAIDAMIVSGGPVDLVDRFALRLTTTIICELLGVPHEQAEQVVTAMKLTFDVAAPPDDRVRANGFVVDVIRRTCVAKQQRPDDSLLSRLVTVSVPNEELTFDEVVTIGRFLIGAGHETTASMLGLGVLALLHHPEQRAALVDPAGAGRTAADEMLRYLSVVQVEPGRVALEDVEIGGQLIRAGEGVVMSLMSANFDPRAFPAGPRPPDELDISRPDCTHHVAFGFGRHQCVGQNLARVEMQVAWTRLFTRLPGLHVAVPVTELDYKYTGINFGLTSLPVDW